MDRRQTPKQTHRQTDLLADRGMQGTDSWVHSTWIITTWLMAGHICEEAIQVQVDGWLTTINTFKYIYQ